MLKRVILVFLLLSGNVLFAREIDSSLNEFYDTSTETILVSPTRGLGIAERQQVSLQVKRYAEFLRQWDTVAIVKDGDFTFDETTRRKKVYLFGTEETNHVLAAHKKSLFCRKQGDQGFEFLGRLWANQDFGAFFLNPIADQQTVVFYLPDLQFLECFDQVYHGDTQFILFNSLAFSGDPAAFLAKGFYRARNGKFAIDPDTLSENTPLDAFLFVKHVHSKTLFEVGDIFASLDGKKIRASNQRFIFTEMNDDKPHSLVVLRRQKEMVLPVRGQEILEGIELSTFPELVPMIPAAECLKEYRRVVKLFQEAYIDTFDFMNSTEFTKVGRELVSPFPTDSVSLVDFYRRLAIFAAAFQDGHVYLNTDFLRSFVTTLSLRDGLPLFPFQPLLSERRLFVPHNSFGLQPGSEILSINRIPVDHLLESISRMLSGDTLDHQLSNVAQNGFGEILFLAGYNQPFYELKLLHAGKETQVKIVGRFITQGENKIRPKAENTCRPLSSDTLLLTIPFFVDSPQYRELLTSGFRQYSEGNFQNLVLDIRQNSGGSTSALNRLFAMVVPGNYRVYKKTRNRKSRLAEKEGFKFDSAIPYGTRVSYSIDSTAVGAEKPLAGRLFLWIGPRTFSTAFDCAAVLQEKRLAILVGQPAGGRIAQSGNHAQIQLLKRGVTISLPYKDFLPAMDSIDNYDSEAAKGLIEPQVRAPLTPEMIQNGLDPCWEATKEYLEREKSFSDLHRNTTTK